MEAKIGAIIQARMESSRLPGKVLKPLLGKPLLYRLIEQLKYSRLLGEIIVATSDQAIDGPIFALGKKYRIKCFRGSADNVLKRYVSCAREFDLDIIIRITADNPLTDPRVVDDVIETRQSHPRLEYINGIHGGGVVHGAGCELVTRPALEKALKSANKSKANQDFYFEHVTTYIRKHGERFNVLKYKPDRALVRNDLFFTVDYPEDYEVMKAIYQGLYQEDKFISAGEVIGFLDRHPDIAALNAHLHEPLPDW